MKRTHQRDDAELNGEGNASSDSDNDDALSDDDLKSEESNNDDAMEPTTDNPPSSEAAPNNDASSSVFLDSFYGIASLDALERTASARVMIQHCLLAPSDAGQMKDAAYALRRLLNGLCSGRAAARQGNAAALTSFLKIAASLDLMSAIRAEWFSSSKTKTEDPKLRERAFQSDLAFVRYALMTVTDPTATSGHGGRKASEERDLRFGRLFGVSAIARSGILLQAADGSEEDGTVAVAKELVADLMDLYRYKKWMREPVAHAICSLLLTLDGEWNHPVARQLIAQLVEHVIIPQLLLKGDNETEPQSDVFTKSDEGSPDALDLVSSYSAEQIAVAVCIQYLQRQHSRRSDDLNDDSGLWSALPYPLNRPLFCVDSVPLMATALVEPSAVTQPRLHLVWDMLFLYLTDSVHSDVPSRTKVDWREPASSALLGESFDDLFGALIRHVVLKGLLEVDITAETNEGFETKGSQKHSKSALDRLSLALSLVRNFAGVEFVSSLRGNTRWILSTEQLETHLFTSVMLQHLFLDVVCVSGKSKQHPLKPFAIDVLEQMVHAFSEPNTLKDDTKQQQEDMNSKSLSFAFALLRCDSRFDSKTKTSTVETLLGLARKGEPSDADNTVMNVHFRPLLDFLQSQILHCDSSASAYFIQGYVDLLFQLGKKINVNEQAASLQEILGFLFIVAFFNCESIQLPANDTSVVSKKKKKSKSRQSIVQTNPIVDIGLKIKELRGAANLASVLPYEVRTVASARFFSLIADHVTSMVHSAGTDKESHILDFLWQVHGWQNHLLSANAKQIVSPSEADDMDVDSNDAPGRFIAQLADAARSPRESDGKALTQWKSSCAILALTLSMHLLSCGGSGVSVEIADPDADDDEDYEETVGFLQDLNDLASSFSTSDAKVESESLATLAELCARILSCPLGVGNQSRGASPTLLREAVKLAWTGGLSLVASRNVDDASALNSEVIRILLNSIGAVDDSEDGNDDGEDEDTSDDDDISNSSEKGLFSDISAFAAVQDHKIDEVVEMDDSSNEVCDDGEEKVDSSRLQSLLEEDSDVDVDEGELEHHEGADAALAKLIRLKQEARKAGQLARERTEIARQMRCMLLIEVLVIGKEGTWGSLLRVDHIMQLVLPILQYRYEIAKSLAKAMEKRSSNGAPEKVALVNRLTALLRNKILKAKVADLEWSKSVDISDSSQEFASSLLAQAMKTNEKDHQALCTSALMYMLRGISDSDLKLKCASTYGEAVTLWATKRTCKLDVLFLESLISQYPVLAQACAGEALATAAANGRSTYIKSESYRLLSLLFNPKVNASVSAFEQLAMKCIVDASNSVLASIIVSLNDTEMIKTKRVRDVLRATDKIVSFLSTTSSVTRDAMTQLHQINDLLKKIKEASESQGIVNSVDNLMRMIEDLASSNDFSHTSMEQSPRDSAESKKEDDSMDVDAGAAEKVETVKSKKKKKSKKR